MTSDEFGDQLEENLNKWFKEKWVRFGPDGKIRGDCARGSSSEGKPKCLPKKKAQALGKKGRKYAGAKKRREDPNPERKGKAKNVATKKKSNESINEGVPFSQCPKCRGPIVHESMMTEKQDACYHKVKSRYKVWPSAYASGALVQCRKKGASNWGTGGKKKNESSIMKGIVDEFAGDSEPGQPRREYPITVYIYSIRDNKTIKLIGEKLGELTPSGYIKTQFTLPNSGRTITELLPVVSEKYPTGKLSDSVYVKNTQKPNEVVSDDVFEYWAYDPQLTETEAKKGADGKARWKSKDKCVPVKNESAYEADLDDNEPRVVIGVYGAKSKEFRKKFANQKAQDRFFDHPDREGNFEIHYVQKADVSEGVITQHDATDPEVAILGGAGTMSLSRLKKKAHGEALQLADDIANGKYSASSYNMKQLHNTLNTIVAAEKEMEKNYFGEDFTGMFAAEKTPAINPYGGQKDIQQRGALGEELEEARPMSPALKAAQGNLAGLASGEVQRREQQRKEAARLQKQASKDLARMNKPKKPTLDQIWQKVEHAISNYFPDGDPTDYLGPYMQKTGINWDDITRAAKKNGYKDLWDYWNTLTQDIEDDAYGDWLATGGKNVRTRGQFMEEPTTSGPVGTQPGGWRRTDMSENAHEMALAKLQKALKNPNVPAEKKKEIAKQIEYQRSQLDKVNEEQIDELKCWTGYTRVKGVPAGAPGSCKKKTKESSIMRGLNR